MKAFLLILFVLCIDGISSEPINRDLRKPRIDNECLAEYGIEPEINYNSQEGIPALTEEQMYCVAACIYRDDGLMKPDGTIDSMRAEEYFENYKEEREIFDAILDTCREGNTHCSLVQCMFRELRRYTFNPFTPLTTFKQMLPADKDVEFA